jgi:hypothetical protein
MTIDERLDRLTERHEALTQTVELLAADLRNLEAIVQKLGGIVTGIAEGTARLLHVAEIREQRINRLEAQEPS